MICKIKALCWKGIEYKTPSVTYFYTEVENLDKDILKIGNFVTRKSYYTDNILYTYLILNREFLSSQASMDIKIEYVFYDELSVLLEHDKFVQYYENYYLIDRGFGKHTRYNNIDEVLDDIKFFKNAEGNQFSYIAGDYKIEACNWRYIEANYFKEEKQNNSLVQATEKVSWNEYNKKKNGGKSMFNNLMKNFKFGKMDTNAIKYSFNGIAFQTADNDYVVYNPDMTFTNVSEMVMDIPIYVMPVPKSDVKIGDIIIHNSEFVIVQSIESKEIRIARPRTKEIVGVIPEKSVFGFDFYTKVIDFTKNFSNSATSSNPFGNLPMLMMMDNKDNKDNNNDMLMLMMMNGGKMDFNNPMFMYMMMSKSEDKSNLLPLMMLMNQNSNGEPMTEINNSESNIVLNTEGLDWYPID